MEKTILIDQHYCGPPNSGNGGYVCGKLAQYIEGVAEVSLRKPPPLNTSLYVQRTAQGVQLLKGEELIAEAKSAELEMEIPTPPSYEEAVLFSQSYRGFDKHFFPACFVCGPERTEDDGLRIFAGPSPDRKMVSAPWRVSKQLFDANDQLPREYYWAALDCPGAYAMMETTPKMMVLGRLTAKIIAPIAPEEKLVVIGWPMGASGRKHYAGTALFGKKQELKAYAKAVWIEIPGNVFN